MRTEDRGMSLTDQIKILERGVWRIEEYRHRREANRL